MSDVAWANEGLNAVASAVGNEEVCPDSFDGESVGYQSEEGLYLERDVPGGSTMSDTQERLQKEEMVNAECPDLALCLLDNEGRRPCGTPAASLRRIEVRN